MPRKARVIIDGGAYHVIARGNNNQVVFHSNPDFERYLDMLILYSLQHELKVYHYVLMPNHVHLILQTAQGFQLSRAMRRLNLTYTLFYRKRYQYTGHLWHGRFTSRLIQRESSLLECGHEIELHPVRAGLVPFPERYPWSSYSTYGLGTQNSLLVSNPLYGLLGTSPTERQKRYRQLIREGFNNQDSCPAKNCLAVEQSVEHI